MFLMFSFLKIVLCFVLIRMCADFNPFTSLKYNYIGISWRQILSHAFVEHPSGRTFLAGAIPKPKPSSSSPIHVGSSEMTQSEGGPGFLPSQISPALWPSMFS